MKFNPSDNVVVINYCDPSYNGVRGTVINYQSGYVNTSIPGMYDHLFKEDEIMLDSNRDCVGNTVNAGDIIVYFTRSGSNISHQKAKVEAISVKRHNRPHILVLKEDAVQKDLFTRKSWLWSFDNSVKVG